MRSPAGLVKQPLRVLARMLDSCLECSTSNTPLNSAVPSTAQCSSYAPFFPPRTPAYAVPGAAHSIIERSVFSPPHRYVSLLHTPAYTEKGLLVDVHTKAVNSSLAGLRLTISQQHQLPPVKTRRSPSSRILHKNGGTPAALLPCCCR